MIPDLEIPLLRTFVAVHDTGASRWPESRSGGLSRRSPTRCTGWSGRSAAALDGERRHGALTRDGEVLLAYARKLLRLNDEIRDRFGGPDIAGRVRLGVPDLYAAFLLPSVLAGFARVYPQVEIELRCSRSHNCALPSPRGDRSRADDETAGSGGRRHRAGGALVWVASRDDFDLDSRSPIPGAAAGGKSLPPMRLDALGQTDRSWTITAVSDSIAGASGGGPCRAGSLDLPAMRSGRGDTAAHASSGLPDLPALKIVLQRKAGEVSSASII